MDFEQKVKELTEICLRYSEEAYSFISYLKSNPEVYNKIEFAVQQYKSVIDSCIEKGYRDYLEHKYIIKDISNIAEFRQKQIEEQLFNELSDIEDMEDDTDTLVIKEWGE